ncbi:unnamed protein product [Aphanomyces euteiches]
MPVLSAISPKYNEGLSIEALHNAGLLTDTSMKMYTPQNLTRLNRFESIFQFFTVPDSSKYAEVFHHIMALSALISCGSLFLRTLDGPNLDSLYPDYPTLPDEATYKLIDGIFTVLFSLDFIIRLVIWPSMWKDCDVLRERRLLPFAKDIFNWFDLLALVPFYVDTIFGDGTSFVVMRLARLLRIFRLAKFRSVATVGYGDVVPLAGNALGRITAIVIMIMGTLFLSMPLAIVGTEFDRAWRDHTEKVVQRSLESMRALAAGRPEATKHDPIMDDNPEILTKYMIPNTTYLRLASLAGEMALISSALANELKYERDNSKVEQIARDLHAHMELCFDKYKELVRIIDEIVCEPEAIKVTKNQIVAFKVLVS